MEREIPVSKNLQSNESGTVTVIFGMMLVVLLLISGLAIDTSRYYNVSTRLQASLDEAALAGAKLLPDDTKSDEDIRLLTFTHFSQFLDRSGIPIAGHSELNIDVNRKSATVAANINVEVQSVFGPLGGLAPAVTISRSSQATYDAQKLELSMVLDVTGSMAENNKLNDLKTSAKNALDTLYANASSDEDVKIALAPYAASVNAGGLANSVTSTAPTQLCTLQGNNGSGPNRRQSDCRRITYDVDPCVVERTGANASTDAAAVGVDALPNVPSNEYYYDYDTRRSPDGHYSCPSAHVAPLRGKSQQGEIASDIDALTADGYTAGQIGAAWGWYLISPEWKNVLTGVSQPAEYSNDRVQKAMIIMTDGIFNTEYSSGATPKDSIMIEKSYQEFQDICSAAKTKKIQIYTIYFEVTNRQQRAIDELTQCASDPSSFYDASSGADLNEAFKSIASRLIGLRVAG